MANQAAQIPPPPPGFELLPMDGASTGSNIPPPPPGFELISDAKMSVGEDVARSAGAGVRRGVIEGLTGMAGDTAAMTGDVAAWLASKLGASDETSETVRNVGRYASPFFGMPTTDEVETQITDPLMGDTLKHDPQTVVGEYAKTGAEFLPAALGNRGSLIRRGAQVAIPAITSETAGQVAEQVAPEFEPVARALGAIAGGGGVELTRGRGASGAVARAVEGATPQQLTAAERLFRQAEAQGTPITRFEALQQITGGGTRAGDMQRVVEGQGGLRDFMAARPGQNEAAARRTFDTVAPVHNAPSTIGPSIGETAEGILTDVRQGINRATEPMYRAAEQIPPQTGVGPNAPRRIDAQTFQQVQNAPGWNEARNAIRNDPQLVRYVQGMPDDSIAFLNEVQKYLAQQGDNAAGPMNAQRNQQRAAGYGQDATAVRTAAEQASPDFAQAVQTQAQLRQQYLDPLLQGPVGKIAARDTGTQDAINALFPRNPLPNSAQEIGRTVGMLSRRNPFAARQLVRAHIESTFNQASRELQSGANQFGGAGFAAKLRGNPQQAANLEASVRALPNGDDIWQGFDRFLEVLEAQGQRQRIGSQTAFNTEAIKDLSAGSPLGSTGAVAAGGGFQWPRKAMEVFERWRLGRNVDEIARLITDPLGARVFRELAGSEHGRGVVNHSIRLLFLARQGTHGAAGQ
jgi:hypothetical protein